MMPRWLGDESDARAAGGGAVAGCVARGDEHYVTAGGELARFAQASLELELVEPGLTGEDQAAPDGKQGAALACVPADDASAAFLASPPGLSEAHRGCGGP